MVVHPSMPAKTVPEFTAYPKANPGKINMASGSEGFGREYFFSTFQSARGILEPSRTVLDATATKWSLDVAQTTSRLDYQKMETMAESARRVGSLSPSLT